MKKAAILVFLLKVSAFTSVSQPILSLLRFNDEWLFHQEDLTIDCKFIRDELTQKLISYRVYFPNSKQIDFEMFRFTDSTFFFIKYDTSYKEISKGLLEIDFKTYDSTITSIPNQNMDPDGSKGIFKDTVVKSYHFKKQRFWRESNASSFTNVGEYKNGKRNGTWAEGKYFYNNYWPIDQFIPTKYENYLEGKLDSSSIKLLNEINWPDLKGKWFFNPDYGDTAIHFYARDSINNKRKNFITFLTESTYQFRCDSKNPIYTYQTTTCIDDWWVKGDRIFLKRGSKVDEFKVISLTRETLVLELASWDK